MYSELSKVKVTNDTGNYQNSWQTGRQTSLILRPAKAREQYLMILTCSQEAESTRSMLLYKQAYNIL